jgi:hypothetical protein
MPITYAEVLEFIRTNTKASTSEFRDEDIKVCINQAIDSAVSDNLYVPIVDESLEFLEDTWEYPLAGSPTPTNLDSLSYIYNLYLESDVSGVFLEPINEVIYSVQNATVPFLLFDRYAYQGIVGRKIRIVGSKVHARVTDPDDTVYLPSTWVTWRATSIAHGILSGSQNNSRAQWHERRVQYAEAMVEAARLGAKQFYLPTRYKLVPTRY